MPTRGIGTGKPIAFKGKQLTRCLSLPNQTNCRVN